jgi:hypothetical protein
VQELLPHATGLILAYSVQLQVVQHTCLCCLWRT